MNICCTLLDPHARTWAAELDALYALLGAPANPLLVPLHFVKTTFPALGGRVVQINVDGAFKGVGLVFPHASQPERYTLRLHLRNTAYSEAPIVAAVAQLLAPAQVVAYNPATAPTYLPTHAQHAPFDLGRPSAAGAAAARDLQADIWASNADALYPADLYAPAAGAATTLVARHNDRLAGFLLGFYRSQGLHALADYGHRSDLGIESQIMAIAPLFRRYGLAALLKRQQAQLALHAGINVISWTADPLQFANAALNFGTLRAVAGVCYPNYYPFQNALNQVPASRLGIFWLLGSQRGQQGLANTSAAPTNGLQGATPLNDGPTVLPVPDNAPTLALEIPAHWTALQRDDPAQAAQWRTTTDALLTSYLDLAPGGYLVTNAVAASDRRYLVLQRFAAALVQ